MDVSFLLNARLSDLSPHQPHLARQDSAAASDEAQGGMDSASAAASEDPVGKAGACSSITTAESDVQGIHR